MQSAIVAWSLPTNKSCERKKKKEKKKRRRAPRLLRRNDGGIVDKASSAPLTRQFTANVARFQFRVTCSLFSNIRWKNIFSWQKTTTTTICNKCQKSCTRQSRVLWASAKFPPQCAACLALWCHCLAPAKSSHYSLDKCMQGEPWTEISICAKGRKREREICVFCHTQKDKRQLFESVCTFCTCPAH